MQFDINGSIVWDDITAASKQLHRGIIHYDFACWFVQETTFFSSDLSLQMAIPLAHITYCEPTLLSTAME